MTVTLYVDWKGKEVLTEQQVEKRIKDSVERTMSDKEVYQEYLDDYIDFNYTKLELFDALSGNDATREEVLADIRSEVANAIYDYCECDVRDNYEEVTIEV